MQRDAYNKLMDWKSSARRKPLLLKGARQTGKTYLLKAFGKAEYDSLIYFNFEEDPNLKGFFDGRIRPAELIENLSLYAGQKIRPAVDLIVFDEIQASDGALKSIKYFYEDAPEYHIAGAGSLLGISLSGPGAFPVGKVNFIDLYPMTFMEFLSATGSDRLRQYITKISEIAPLPEPFHRELISKLRTYYFTGGMPEAVDHYATTNELLAVREIQKEILTAYALDFAKYASTPDIPKLGMIWDAIPAQLAKENKKFVFSALRKSARIRDFENAIEWLEKAGLILRCFRISTAKQPLSAYRQGNIFKIYALDVGLLGAMTKMDPSAMIQADRVFREFQGALVENFVATQLKAVQDVQPYYWQSAGTAEVDFVCEHGNKILPLEVKAGVNPKSKSLKSFDQKYNPPLLARTTLLNLKKEDRIVNIPLYAIARFPEICSG
jgi:predicted AAA+ superfamily ATPase